ncbi:MAG: sel1 repeat family protein [Bacteroidales bacterium]|nr:sel1 repeat family protein [Bacteroidales bacterium]
MANTFEITHDRAFLQHFLTRWRTMSLAPEMVGKLKENKETDPYAAYGYGRWLSLANPGGNSLKEADELLSRAGQEGVPDALAALAPLFYDGRMEEDKANHQMHAYLMDTAYKAGSELAQFNTLLNTVYGDYGYRQDPALVADILQKHIDKNPECDPIYYDLLGQALEDDNPDAAQKAYRASLERGETESYYSLAQFYKNAGEWARAVEIAEEGARNGAVNCHRFKATMAQETFEQLPPEQQEALHREIAEGLDYAIAHHDAFACYLKGVLMYQGHLGYSDDIVAALEPLERGCELGKGHCYWLKAIIQHDFADTLPPELKASARELARTCLQAVRQGDREKFTLEQMARGYVAGVLPQYEEEIENCWLKEYLAANPEEEDTKDSLGVISVYPQGFYYAMDVENGDGLDLEDLASQTGAQGFDIVHFSPLLTRLTKAVSWDKEGCHVAMLVDRDGYMKDLPDNMPGTLIYGQGQEIRGTVVFILEDDKSYRPLPMKGLQHVYLFLQMLKAASGDLIREPSSEELEAIGAEDGGFEEYDDPDIFDNDFEPEQEMEEDMVCAPAGPEEAPREVTVSVDDVLDGIAQCNLCIDTLHVVCPSSPEYDFMSAEDLLFKLDIKDAVEKNIKRHGGYMIDEWQYVDARQIPMDIRSRVRFEPAE